VLAGWDAFRAQLDNHHWAEDDDLWPVLRGELPIPVTWHRSTPWWRSAGRSRPRSRGVDAALRGGGELTAPAGLLSAVVLDHLAREEREVLPPYRAAPDPGAVARVPAQGTEPPLATGTARVPDLDPRRRRRAGCGGGPGRDAAAGPAGLPPGAPPPLRRAASVADPSPAAKP
jgi:hypothetical protein